MSNGDQPPGRKRSDGQVAHTSAIIYNSTVVKPCQWHGDIFLVFFRQNGQFFLICRLSAQIQPCATPVVAPRVPLAHGSVNCQNNELNPAKYLSFCRISVLFIRCYAPIRKSRIERRAQRRPVDFSPSPWRRPASGFSECQTCRKTRSPGGPPQQSARSGSFHPAAFRTSGPAVPTGRRPASPGWC